MIEFDRVAEGVQCAKNGKSKAALDLYKEALAQDPDNADARVAIGALYVLLPTETTLSLSLSVSE